MDQDIKKAVENQLIKSNYRPELKEKTLKYIRDKSNKASNYPNRLRQFSMITVCTVFLMVGLTYRYFTMKTITPQRQTLSSVNLSTSQRHIVSSLTEILNELELNHQEKITVMDDSFLMITYNVEGMSGYEIEFEEPIYQFDVCRESDKILNNHGIKLQSYQIIKLNENRIFIFNEMPSLLLEYLNADSTTLFCS